MRDSVGMPDWTTLPSPEDDGSASHLTGKRVPSVGLPATDGTRIDLSSLPGVSVVYAFPRMGRPGVANPDGWDAIPGARGCTPETCSFRDHFAELRASGASHVFGLSTQDTAYQREAVERLHLPFSLLSDTMLDLTHAMHLPTLEVDGMTLLRRLTLVVNDGVVEHIFYPIFPPDTHAGIVVDWLSQRASA